ncbi:MULTISPECIES: DUF4865 family protein [unclassified Methylobacterium]|jgi:hypothetical protein|uniref:DUF4865 family protein n=1 Tax=unclassified Methylobacterium TaxID=2615210 RepID=UPI00135227A0|nr:DUF4865 family protein [Methylobacterium sp. 2A]MWV23799.1 DUF4865 family protein [Methylobacterium sp. 2A]
MILTRYRHPLPADYDMARIRDRVAARGPLWDDAPGLVFKAFTIEDRARGAAANAYSSLYLWHDPAAAAGFFAGAAFQAVIETFGRPRTEVWLPFTVSPGGAAGARSLAITERILAADADLAAERRAEAEQGGALAAEPDVLAVVSGLDPAAWRLVRFVLRADGPAAGTPEIAHLAAPGIAVLRGAPAHAA